MVFLLVYSEVLNATGLTELKLGAAIHQEMHLTVELCQRRFILFHLLQPQVLYLLQLHLENRSICIKFYHLHEGC